MNNISPSINDKRHKKLHNRENHPLCMLKKYIQQYFTGFEKFDHLSEVVTVQANFDDLLIPSDHPARLPTDTYYVDQYHVLRTATSAHQTELLRKGYRQFLITGEVYRKDTIDRTHYPVFHQVEGVKLLDKQDALQDLIITLEGLIRYLFPESEYRILDDYFPFTEPSIQFEVKYKDEWLEVLGAGVIHPDILRNCQIHETGWAFGLGLDRLLMKMCSIPDIRYLWSEDARFYRQFQNGLAQFQEYSRYPAIYRDISFWIHDYTPHEQEDQWIYHHDFCEKIRELSSDLIESIERIDFYQKNNDTSLAYRIGYRSYDRTLTNEEVNEIQSHVRKMAEETFDIELR